MDELRAISDACKKDERLLKIVKDVAKMTPEEKEEFAIKVRKYFLLKNSEEDQEAYKFFKVILKDKNALKILEFIGCK
ncbi:hypothetical protein JYK00_05155 [Thermosipho ferrireducens]|uniref:Uncharacterized protein n=1 Tax=Thermosipho ferrireducens TaxID=2571116 RepID=A0ABX7S6D5_9BACT|nr:hypothetical protein [Thermosipho ferrireducens]QTA37142.1 hypothetical protein JYK00_05155 [Thermosipho ferrireducens]